MVRQAHHERLNSVIPVKAGEVPFRVNLALYERVKCKKFNKNTGVNNGSFGIGFVGCYIGDFYICYERWKDSAFKTLIDL